MRRGLSIRDNQFEKFSPPLTRLRSRTDVPNRAFVLFSIPQIMKARSLSWSMAAFAHADTHRPISSRSALLCLNSSHSVSLGSRRSLRRRPAGSRVAICSLLSPLYRLAARRSFGGSQESMCFQCIAGQSQWKSFIPSYRILALHMNARNGAGRFALNARQATRARQGHRIGTSGPETPLLPAHAGLAPRASSSLAVR